MTFEEYLSSLNKIAKEKPETLKYIVVYSHDDEGNNFQKVNYDGTLGNFDGDYYGNFDQDGEPKNAICIN
jgi:hypothetical protein